MAKQNNLESAVKIILEAIKQNPYDADMHYTLARIYKEEGNNEGYLEELKEAMNNSDSLSFEPRLLENEIRLAVQDT